MQSALTCHKSRGFCWSDPTWVVFPVCLLLSFVGRGVPGTGSCFSLCPPWPKHLAGGEEDRVDQNQSYERWKGRWKGLKAVKDRLLLKDLPETNSAISWCFSPCWYNYRAHFPWEQWCCQPPEAGRCYLLCSTSSWSPYLASLSGVGPISMHLVFLRKEWGCGNEQLQSKERIAEADTSAWTCNSEWLLSWCLIDISCFSVTQLSSSSAFVEQSYFAPCKQAGSLCLLEKGWSSWLF